MFRRGNRDLADRAKVGRMTPGRKILVGIIGAAHGVKGELRVKTYTAEPRAIGDYGPLTTDDSDTSLTVAALRPLKDDMVVVRFREIRDRNAAEALTNRPLYVDRAALPPPEEEEFYNADLIGLAARTDAGRRLGRVIGVANFGAGDLLEIAPDDGDTLLVPFTKSFVPIVDLAGGGIVVTESALTAGAQADPPAGED
jgi:16S rRNA processing protein RimM